MVYTEIEERCKGDAPIESQVSEWSPLLSKLLLTEKVKCSWVRTSPQTMTVCLLPATSTRSLFFQETSALAFTYCFYKGC